MRIQLICAAFPPFGKGGGPATSELIAQSLVASGHEVEVLVASDEAYDKKLDGYRVLSIGSPNIYADYWVSRPAWQRAIWHLLENFNPRAYFRVGKAIDRFGPDIVATVSIENVNVATWLAASRRKLPIIHFLHSYFLICWRGSLFRGGAKCVARCTSCKLSSVGKTTMASLVDVVVGESGAVIEKHREAGLFRDAVPYILPTPATERVCEPTPKGEPGLTVTIGYIGNISSEKGLGTLAQASKLLRAEHGDAVRFLVAGSGTESLVAELKRAFSDDSARFLGWVVAEEFYSEVDIVVVPSLWDEPYGRVSVEPLSYGIPVVVARSGGLVENIEDEISGRIFEAGDATGLAAILSELVTDRTKLAALGRGALARSKKYDFPIFSAQLNDIVRAVSGQIASPKLAMQEQKQGRII